MLTRFPGIAAICAEFGLDITRDRIPVRPGAHYMMGGVSVDLEGRTTLPGLWAAGEVTASGLHGANRLASNSLLEALVYGAHAGEGAAAGGRHAHTIASRRLPVENTPCPTASEPLNLDDIRNALKSLMWRSAGVRRDAEGLAGGGGKHGALVPLRVGPAVRRSRRLGVAKHVVRGLADDPRGPAAAGNARGPRRTDFPATDDQHWQRHLTFSRG